MGVVIAFPADHRPRSSQNFSGEMGQILILPAIRIERYDDEPALPQPRGGSDSLSGASRSKRKRLAR